MHRQTEPHEARAARGRLVTTLLRCVLPSFAATTVLSCAETSPSQARSPNEEAAAVERSRCGPDIDDTTLEPIFSHRAVESAEPLYARTGSDRAGTSMRLQGAIVYVRAIQGVTTEWLDRALECHSARRVLGKIAEDVSRNDPFWLPGRMVDIDTQSAGHGFRIAIRGATPDDAQEILIRANAFAATSPSPASPGAQHPDTKAELGNCDYYNYYHDESKTPSGPGTCATDCDCDGMRACRAGVCGGDARPPIDCDNPNHHWNEAWNPQGPGRCSSDCDCDGRRTCEKGMCTGAAR
jgi:hypothetical protein